MSVSSDREIAKKLNQLTRQSPFYKKFNERRYGHVKGYIEHEEVMFALARTMTGYQYYDSSIFERDFTHKTSIITLDRAYREGFGSYWLGGELFEAFLNTCLPSAIGNIRQVIPSGVLLVPPKLKNPDGVPLKWLCFSHRIAGDTIPPIRTLSDTLYIQPTVEESLSWVTIFEDGTQYGVNRHLKIENHQLDFHDDKVYINQSLEYRGANTDTTTEKEFIDRVTELLIQVLLYLQRPRSLEESVAVTGTARTTRRETTGKKQKLTPIMIGRDYRIKRERVSIETGGDPRSIATHWRRGFHRWQPYGSRSEPTYELIWIEPTLVNE
ncbi:hypothetical protein V0288_23835 [Pannus brasiliensis CCIBt3594]|uniref:Uncharacterized protein n=1 Tax=Pannus brasiliensis CCIBt3594 TaxID=1427578 RepID=A0AAW9QZX5_9CHRO